MIKLVELFADILREAKCPSCGDPGAYHGFTDVECPNPKCQHHHGNGGKRTGLQPRSNPNPIYNPNALFDHFSKDFHDFKSSIDGAARRIFGHNWKDVIDWHQGWPGATDERIKQMWDANATDHETMGEIGFYYDNAQRGIVLPDPSYRYAQIVKGQALGPVIDPFTGDPRIQRPMSPADVSP